MSDNRVVVDVVYDERETYTPQSRFQAIEVLADINSTQGNVYNSLEPKKRFSTALERFEKMGDHYRSRFQALLDAHGDYLIAEYAKQLTPTHHRYVFVPGAGVEEFALEFTVFMYTSGAEKVTTTITSEYYSQKNKAYKNVLELSKGKIFKKVSIENNQG